MSTETLELLRARTRAAHRALDQAVLDIWTRGPRHSRYGAFLDASWTWVPVLESALWRGDWSPELMVERRARKREWLAADLVHLRRDPADLLEGVHRRQAPILDWSDSAACFGVAYVVEGATLGGQALRQRWSRDVVAGADRFLHGYGPETGPMWKTFLAWLAQIVRSPDEQHRCVRAAEATFAFVAEGFKRLEPLGSS